MLRKCKFLVRDYTSVCYHTCMQKKIRCGLGNSGMRLNKQIIIDETDVSELHSEVSEIIDFFISNTAVGADEEWLKKEFPHILKMLRLLETVVMGEQGDLIYDKISKLTSRVDFKANLRLVDP